MKPVTIAVTGGIGSGKTTVCRMLEKRGAAVFYADVEAKRLMTEDAKLVAAITDTFGPEAYHEDGSLNRAFLASQVFGDADRLAALNELVHPRVYAAFGRFQAEAVAQDRRLIVRESAILPEGDARKGLDAIVVVIAGEAVRVGRVRERDAATEEQVRQRMGHQKSGEEFAMEADHIIPNDGSLADLERSVAALFHTLTGTSPDRPVQNDPYPPLSANVPRWGNAFTRVLGRLILGLGGFRFVGPFPDLKKYVLIGAPHTSNWDFVYGMALLLATGVRVNWIGKHTIFRPPFGWFMRWLGGVPVDRTRADGLVAQVCEAMDASERMVIGLAPEGTRKAVDRWKTGFYRIAVGAGVPIAIGMLDFGRRELRLDSLFEPTGDMEADIAAIRARYNGVEGKYPENFVS